MIGLLRRSVLWELLEEYPDFRYFDRNNLTRTMQDTRAQEKYLDFLRDLLKDKSYIQLAYMTGILPIMLLKMDEMLLVGINYDKKTRKHSCVIEEYPPLRNSCLYGNIVSE